LRVQLSDRHARHPDREFPVERRPALRSLRGTRAAARHAGRDHPRAGTAGRALTPRPRRYASPEPPRVRGGRRPWRR
ncbi:MAG: hypothetical protein ACK55I_39985, partial [bacterium]